MSDSDPPDSRPEAHPSRPSGFTYVLAKPPSAHALRVSGHRREYGHGHRSHAHAHLHGTEGGALHPHGHEHAHDHGHEHAHDHGHDHVHGHTHGHEPPRELVAGVGAGALLHLDCFSGIAGDMLVAALLDLGVPREPIARALEALPLSDYRVGTQQCTVSAIVATRFAVDVEGRQPQRTYADICAMLEAAPLDPAVRASALETFRVLAIAEGRVHRVPPEQVHFHEVGAVDSIVDIVAACAALQWLGARVTCTPLPMGRGFTRSQHGIIPLPAPAVVEVLAGVPTRDAHIEGELVTPTGAALVRALATEFVEWPSIAPIATGFGAGTRTLRDRPNVLRVVLGAPIETSATGRSPSSSVVVLETNLDDATGEGIAHALEALLVEGALDAWTTAIGMKKGRPGVQVSVLTRAHDADRLARVLLRESPSLGVRMRPADRIERPRRVERVETVFGAISVKVSDGDGLPRSAKPEDAEVRALAQRANVAPRTVHAAALSAYWRAHPPA